MIKSMNVAWWVQRWSELHPSKPAIFFEGREISYLQLHQKANQTSCWLQSLGIEKGDRVAVMLQNCPEFMELYIACSRLGAIFVPVNFRLAAPELAYTLRNSRPRLFVFASAYSETVMSLDLNTADLSWNWLAWEKRLTRRTYFTMILELRSTSVISLI